MGPTVQDVGGGSAPVRKVDDEEELSRGGWWFPSQIVKEQRRAGSYIWLALIGGFVVYAAALIIYALLQRSNPPVFLDVVEGGFPIPDIGFCFDEYGYGCIVDGTLCAGNSTGWAYIRSGLEESSLEQVSFEQNSPRDGCVFWKASELTLSGGAESFGFGVALFWDTAGRTNATAADIDIETELTPTYLYDPDWGQEEREKAPISFYTPFNKVDFTDPAINAAKVSGAFSNVILSVTQYKTLDGDIRRVYEAAANNGQPCLALLLPVRAPALPSVSVQTKIFTLEDGITIEPAPGANSAWIIAEIFVTFLSYQSIEEQDPVDWLSIFGELGGFWEVVLIAMGFFFISSSKAPPDMKLRCFHCPSTKAAKRASASARSEEEQPPPNPGVWGGGEETRSPLPDAADGPCLAAKGGSHESYMAAARAAAAAHKEKGPPPAELNLPQKSSRMSVAGSV